MINFNPEVGPITLAIVVLLNIVGYVIYRYKPISVTALDMLDIHDPIPGPRKLSAASWPRIQSPRWMEFRQKMGPEAENSSCQVGSSH